MSDNLPALPEPHSARSFFCNKCGYFGTDGPNHNWPSGKSSCNYAAVSIGPFYTAEQMRAFRAEGVAAERSLWQEDAERYRWLRSEPPRFDIGNGGVWCAAGTSYETGAPTCLWAMDAAIDAARKA